MSESANVKVEKVERANEVQAPAPPAAGSAVDSPPPAMPWKIEHYKVGEGDGRPQAFKFVNGIRLWASPEDVAVWCYLQHLEAQIKSLRAAIESQAPVVEPAAAIESAKKSRRG